MTSADPQDSSLRLRARVNIIEEKPRVTQEKTEIPPSDFTDVKDQREAK